MKVTIYHGPYYKKGLDKAYQYLLELYRKEKSSYNDRHLRKGIDRRTSQKGIQHRRTDPNMFEKSWNDER